MNTCNGINVTGISSEINMGAITGKKATHPETKNSSRNQVCSHCGLKGHNPKRCRSYTDGRGNLMKEEVQESENKLSIVIEIGLPGQTCIPNSSDECAKL